MKIKTVKMSYFPTLIHLGSDCWVENLIYSESVVLCEIIMYICKEVLQKHLQKLGEGKIGRRENWEKGKLGEGKIGRRDITCYLPFSYVIIFL